LDFREGEFTTKCPFCGNTQFIKYPQESENINTMLTRTALALRDENWSDAAYYCDKALDFCPTNAMAYFYRFLARHKSSGWNDLIVMYTNLENDLDYQKALEFGEAAFRVQARQFVVNSQCERIYVAAIQEAGKMGRQSEKYERAINLLQKIPEYRDSSKLIKKFNEKKEAIEETLQKERLEEEQKRVNREERLKKENELQQSKNIVFYTIFFGVLFVVVLIIASMLVFK